MSGRTLLKVDMAGKGDLYRSVDLAKYNANFDRIFSSRETFIGGRRHAFLEPFCEYLDISFSNDQDLLKKSEKTYISWGWFNDLPIFKYRREHGLPSICVERGALPRSIFFDRNGFNFDSISYDELNWNRPLSLSELTAISGYIESFKSEADPNLDLELQNSNDVSRDSISRDINLEGFDKVVFVPFQLSSDVVISHFSGFIGNLYRFVQLIIRLAAKHPNILFLYKNHPLENNLNSETHNLRKADKYHFKACLDACDSVALVNSGIGLQAMIYGKPVLLFGQSFYSFSGINSSITHECEIESLLFNPIKVDVEKAERFLYWLKFNFYSDVDWTSVPNKNTSILEKVNSFQIWSPNGVKKYL